MLVHFQVLRKGLVKAARTTGAWIFTGGTNTGEKWRVATANLKLSRLILTFLLFSISLNWTPLKGVTKQVGEALQHEGQQRTGRLVSIGIAPWGIVERNHELLGHNRDIPYVSISSPRFGKRRQIEFDETENLSIFSTSFHFADQQEQTCCAQQSSCLLPSCRQWNAGKIWCWDHSQEEAGEVYIESKVTAM